MCETAYYHDGDHGDGDGYHDDDCYQAAGYLLSSGIEEAMYTSELGSNEPAGSLVVVL